MKFQRIKINAIPAIIWGEKSDKVYIHVHGKMSCKEHAENFAEIAEKKGYQTLSFDLPEHGERKEVNYRCDIWNGMHDLTVIGDYAFSMWKEVSLFACSLGAYFSLNTYAGRKFMNCLFQSPVLDMEYLIQQMFSWFNVTEEKLCIEKEIPTPVDLLRWDYYQYVKNHPIEKWNIPTSILYGGKDNLQSIEVIQKFVKAHSCKLTISQSSEHSFMQEEDIKIVRTWLEENV
ncbi:alpha/beta hydrolase [Clostridium sp. Marseille-P299]|uniref:alpha/beta hydrolase n=1 Tax=Clostridium sp. Marseille-P299 TaxID=1805477 RepID=UPI000831BC6D|nr:alpha/beta hydrolase [Clostridium sp. Marseille-P299]